MASAHFELHVTDTVQARDFYSDLLGWRFEAMGDLDYHLVLADGIGPDGPLSGALMPRNVPAPPVGTGPRGAVISFRVADVDTVYAKALEIGGEEAMPPTDFNGFGRLAYIEDGQGNIIGLMTRAEEK